jgi:hypothetical protein
MVPVAVLMSQKPLARMAMRPIYTVTERVSKCVLTLFVTVYDSGGVSVPAITFCVHECLTLRETFLWREL